MTPPSTPGSDDESLAVTAPASGTVYKVLGQLDAPEGTGVLGSNTATSGAAHGVEGHTASPHVEAAGVFGAATNSSTWGTGVYGQTQGSLGAGVVGWAPNGGTGVAADAGSGGYALTADAPTAIRATLETWDIDTVGRDFTVAAGTTADGAAEHVVVGHPSNAATTGVGTTISGGGYDDTTTVEPNVAHADYTTIGGGRANTTAGAYATIAGGRRNDVAGVDATVGGGKGNRAASEYAVVAGGNQNDAVWPTSTIGGGRFNETRGEAAFVGGGWANAAIGDYATVAGGGPADTTDPGGTNNVAYDDYCTVAGGADNQAGTSGTTVDAYATVAGGAHNTATGNNATVAGGDANAASALNATVAGGQNNTAGVHAATTTGGLDNTADEEYASIVGGAHNVATGYAAHIGGGEFNSVDDADAVVAGGQHNTAAGPNSTVGGGRYNHARSSHATIGGGAPTDPAAPETTNNVAHSAYSTIGGGGGNRTGVSGSAVGLYATIGGGEGNVATGEDATVAGGTDNTASGDHATVAGGFDNTASARSATVAGGHNNQASGRYSVAAGRLAEATHRGSFVFADALTTPVSTTGDNQFLIQASGGVGIGTDVPRGTLETAGPAAGSANGAPGNHLAILENTADNRSGVDATNANTLAITGGPTSDPGRSVNLVSFYDGSGSSIGAIQGDGNGGITYKTSGSDYAELLPRRDPDTSFEPGDIVGVHDGELTDDPTAADHAMVIATAPNVLGNDPDGSTDAYDPVAFLGQVPTTVRGPVDSGDYIVPTEDGIGRAIPRSDLTRADGPVVGQAWEHSPTDGVATVTVAVGTVPHPPNGDRLAALEADLAATTDRIAALEAENADLRERLHALERQGQPETPADD